MDDDEKLDSEIEEHVDALRTILMPSAIYTLQQNLGRLYQRVEELRKSRDKWKERYNELKSTHAQSP